MWGCCKCASYEVYYTPLEGACGAAVPCTIGGSVR